MFQMSAGLTSPMLSGVEAIHVATVLEDCVDQMAVLGRIMPTTFEFRHDVSEVSRLSMVRINY